MPSAADYMVGNAPAANSYATPILDWSKVGIGNLLQDYLKGVQNQAVPAQAELQKQQAQRGIQAINAFPNGLGGMSTSDIVNKAAQIGGLPMVQQLLPFLIQGQVQNPISGAGGTGETSVYGGVFPGTNAPGKGAPPSTAGDTGVGPQTATGGMPTANENGTPNRGTSLVTLFAQSKLPQSLLGPVARQLGIDPRAPISDDQMPMVAETIRRQSMGARGGSTEGAETPATAPGVVQPGAAPDATGKPGISPATALVPPGTDPMAFSDALQKRAEALRAKAADLARFPATKDMAKPAEDQAQAFEDRAKQIRETLGKEGQSYTEDEIKRFGKKYDSITDAGNIASQELPQLKVAQGLMSDPNFYSGPGEAMNLTYKRLLSTFGGDPNAAQPQEAFRKVISNSILEQIRSMKGTGQIRVAEIKIMEKAAANPDNTPWSNRTLVEMAARLHQRALAQDELARNYKGGRLDAGFDTALRQYDQQHPMFSPQELNDPRLLGSPTLRSPADMGKLPPGTPFRTPDGRYKMVPKS